MLDEKSLRRPDGRFDVEVKLGGTTWCIPKPRVRLGRRRAPDGSPVLDVRSDLGGEFDGVLKSYEDTLADGGGAGLVLAMFAVAEAMLRVNYAIADADLDTLMEFDPDDPDGMRTWQTIIATARGQGPKPNGSGDELDS